MTWNYRVFEWADRKEGTWQSIHEVYYNVDGKPTSYSEEPAVVMSSDPAGNEADLGWVLDRMRDALSKPVLTADEFPEPSQGASGNQATARSDKHGSGESGVEPRPQDRQEGA